MLIDDITNGHVTQEDPTEAYLRRDQWDRPVLAYLVLLDRPGNPRTVEVGKEAVYTARGLWRPSAEHADEWERLTSKLRLEPFYEKSPACVEWEEAVERDNDYDLLSTASATLCLTRSSFVQPPGHLDAGLVTAIATGSRRRRRSPRNGRRR